MTAPAPTIDQIREQWDAIADRFDRFVSPESTAFGEEALRRVDLRPGVRFLDVAAGSGALAIPAARRGADVVATDIAPAMVECLTARAQAEGLTNLEARVMAGDALQLPDDSFHVAASQNGVSLFPNLQAGLRELVRVTRPGGRVLISAFGALQRAEFIGFFMGAVKAAVPEFTPLPMDPPPLAFQVADPSRLSQELADAGLADVQVETVTWDMRFESARQAWDVVTSGNPIALQLIANLTDEQITAAQQVLDGMLRERSGGEPGAVLHNEMNIGIGTK